jgi:DNA replication and repair protein RecF
VFLQRLGLRNFRNFEEEAVEFPERGAALIADNGQGKTNLLEGVYYLEIFRSFRGARDEQLITFGCGHFRVEGLLSDGEGGVEVAAAYARESCRKKVTVDGREPGRMGEAIGHVGAIIFTASDVEIVAGGPGARRRFLDILLSLVEPGYLSALQRYRQILSQRNELLRNGASLAELAAWSAGLVFTGSRITEARARWIAARRASFAHYYGAISGEPEAGLDYVPSVPPPGSGTEEGTPTREGWSESFHSEIQRLAENERRRGLTLVGPHRDDVSFWVMGSTERLQLRSFGSAGQQRTAAIALRMAEAETLRAARGRRPILMLDDVFAELDPQRAERVAGLLTAEKWGQVIVTSPKPTEFALMGKSLAEYRIAGGRVNRL